MNDTIQKPLGTPGRPIRLGAIGLGCRGIGQIETLLAMPDVKIAAVCDVYPDRVEAAQDRAGKLQGFRPDGTVDFRELNRRDDIEAVAIFSSWTSHIPAALDALRCGKRVASEVGGATSTEECWELVRTCKATGLPFMLLENCCYGRDEMTLLSAVRRNVFGEIVHCEGGYAHDLRDEIGNGDINRHYRQDHFLHRNGDLYPTHALGPIAKMLGVNRGNRMKSLVSIASKAAGLHEWFGAHRPGTAFENARVCEGDVVSTIITCANGETILLTHDCTLPRPYSRRLMVQGTRGIWQEENHSVYIDGVSPVHEGEWTHSWETDKRFMAEHMHPLWKAYEEFGLRGGHGGMDYLVLRAFVESVQDGTPPPIDVYDAVAWMCVTCLSEQSVAMGGMPVPFPDFTNGEWALPKARTAGGDYAL